MPSDAVEAQTQALYEAVQGAEALVRAEEQQVLRLLQTGATAAATARLRKLREAITRLQAVVDDNGKVWLRQTMPLAYAEGAVSAISSIGIGDEFAWTQPHVDGVQRLVSGVYDDLLKASREAGRTSSAFATRVRKAASELGSRVLAQQTPEAAGRAIARQLADEGLTGVRYANNSRVGIADYMRMVARTNTALAYNAAAMLEYKTAKVKYLEVFDGPGCGWVSHDSPDKADGSVRSVDDCEAYPISHPNCQRSFGARLDVSSDDEAKAARSSRTPEEMADAAAVEQSRQAEAVTRAASRKSARSRAAVLAKHGRAA